jgi:hypothetical protein
VEAWVVFFPTPIPIDQPVTKKRNTKWRQGRGGSRNLQHPQKMGNTGMISVVGVNRPDEIAWIVDCFRSSLAFTKNTQSIQEMEMVNLIGKLIAPASCPQDSISVSSVPLCLISRDLSICLFSYLH